MFRLVFRVHAIQRIFQRGISEEDVRHVVVTGKTIEEYPGDKPYPSRLILGWCDNRPLHVVVADNQEADEKIIITVYEPNATAWEQDYKRRKIK